MTKHLPDSDDGPAEIWLSPSCGPREWCDTPEWGETCPDCGKPSVRYVRADLIAEARAAERERTIEIVKSHHAICSDALERGGSPCNRHSILALDGVLLSLGRALADETPSAGDR